MTIHACSPPPAAYVSGGPGPTESAVTSKKIWANNDNGEPVYLSVGFLDGTNNQKQAVQATVATWTVYANVEFSFVKLPSADIRVSFKQQGSWSTVGTDAQNVNDVTQPTMNLGWLADSAVPTDSDASTILHEFGHALGLMHEHQSPARNGKIHLKEIAVYKYYRPLLGYNDKLVKSQVIDMYNSKDILNYSALDLKSIMMYFMPASLNEEGINVPPNLVLSDLDKAYITLNYPRITPVNDGWTALKACNVAGVPNDTATQIIDFVNAGQFAKARETFSNWNMNIRDLQAVNGHYLRGVNTSLAAQHGILDKVKQVINNPIFKGVVKNILNQVLVKNDIDTNSIPGSASNDVQNTIGSLIVNTDFGQAITKINKDLLAGPFSDDADDQPPAAAAAAATPA